MSAADYLPTIHNLPALADAAQGCRGCDLYRNATQTVFGEGPPTAQVVLVGEKPGDREDIEGHPFVGPAGRELDKAIETAGLSRQDVYITNAVKHFKWRPRGKRRLHQKPTAGEIQACLPWLEAELEVIEPPVVIALGATAAKILLGSRFRLTQQRGELQATRWAPLTGATWHPSAVVRAPERDDRQRMRAELTGDLARVARALAEIHQRRGPHALEETRPET